MIHGSSVPVTFRAIRGAAELYSPKCLEEEFSEVRIPRTPLVTSSLLWCRKYWSGRKTMLRRRWSRDVISRGDDLAPGSSSGLGRAGRSGARTLGVGRRDEDPRPRVVGLCAVHGGLDLRVLRHPLRTTRDP